MIKKYSGAYTNIADNYAIIFEETGTVSQEFMESPFFGLLCVVQNIVQRGTPTIPSSYLKKEIGIIKPHSKYHFLSEKASCWSKTIKGNVKDSDYPAERFFDEILPKALGEYGFVRNLILPEADFDDIIGEQTAFSGQQVDFYLPQLNLVIEIDGYHHREYVQKKKDESRDHELRRHGIRILRITTDEIRNDTGELYNKISHLKREIQANFEINLYRECLSKDFPEEIIKLETIHRLQLLLLLCLMKQRLHYNATKWRINIADSDVESLQELFLSAYTDLKLWLSSLAGLMKIELYFPEMEFVEDEERADICVDFSLYRRYDDASVPKGNSFIVRNDYYPEKNYYRVAASETLRYNLELEEPSEDRQRLEFLLQNIFGFDHFQEGQIPIISNILECKDTVGILPTGAGKSLCYQFAAMLQPGVTIVIDPIISLMQDQKRSMHKMSINHNEMISSMQGGSEKGKALLRFENGEYQVLWISPERFQNVEFRKKLVEINRKHNFAHAVIDEVHCLSEWGHDFRVSYLALIRTLREFCPAALLLGLTATASEFVLKDIKAEFGGDHLLDSSNVKSMPSMDRPELIFKRIPVSDRPRRITTIKELLAKHIGKEFPDSGLLFCPTVKGRAETSCLNMAKTFQNEWHEQYRLFHGQLSQDERTNNQRDFMEGKFPLMICTKAFGMGVDKQDLRFTIHNSLPASVESFYQEAGRAGRDRKDAYCYIIYNINDRVRAEVRRIAGAGNLLGLIKPEEQDKFDNSDLSTTLFFLRSNHMAEVEERDYIADVLNWLGGHTMLGFHQGDSHRYNDKQKIENALYKLSLIGIVQNWTVQYNNLYTGNITVELIDSKTLTPERALQNFINYVRKYDIEFTLESDEGREYKSILDQKGNPYVNIVQMLVRWTNYNILYQRIQCSKTIMDWCSPNVDDETFRRNLEGYFRFTEETILLEHIAYHPMDWRKWFDCLYELNDERTSRLRTISKEKAQENYASLQRFLESYRNNTGLNYLDGLLQLYIQPNVSEADLARMKRGLEDIQSLSERAVLEIIRETCLFSNAFETVERKDLLSKVLLDYFPNAAKIIFRGMQDRYSLSHELERATARLEGIKWII